MRTLTLSDRQSGVTVLSNTFLDVWLPQADGDAVRIYLYFLRRCGCADADVTLQSAADTLHLSVNAVQNGLHFWEQAGLLQLSCTSGQLTGIQFLPVVTDTPAARAENITPAAEQKASSDPAAAAPADVQTSERAGRQAADHAAAVLEAAKTTSEQSAGSPAGRQTAKAAAVSAHTEGVYHGVRAYTADTLAHFQETHDEELFFVIEQYLGKPLGPTDVNTIVYFGEELGFSSELIIYLFDYCVSNNHYSIHYIEKTAQNWHANKITTAAQAKEYAGSYNRQTFEILRALGIRNRYPTPSQEEDIHRWTRTYGFSLPLILEACRRTAEATGSPSFQYTEKILHSWYENKVGSMDDVRRLDAAHALKKNSAGQSHSKASVQKYKNTSPRNQFHNFTERELDYEEMENMLLRQFINQEPPAAQEEAPDRTNS